MVFADSRVIADRVYGAVLPMSVREDMKTAACGMPMEQELMRTSS
jgi:hypothetical protein